MIGNDYIYQTSNILKKYANKIISELNLKNFTFVHIRRGDFLETKNVDSFGIKEHLSIIEDYVVLLSC